MKAVLVVTIGLISLTGLSQPLSQNYNDYIRNSSIKFDSRLELPTEVKLGPSRSIDMSLSPFKTEVKRLKIAEKKLKIARKAMVKKYNKSGTTQKETIRHKNAREEVKAAKKQIVRRFNVLCGSDVPKIEKLNKLVRGLKKKIEMAKGKKKEKLSAIHDKHLEKIRQIIQHWVDDVFVYYDFPYADTNDNKLYPSRNRSFYNIINRSVQKAIKKGGFAAAEEDKTEDEDDVEVGSEYTRKYTEITKDFMQEHFDGILASGKINQMINPFKAFHTARINKLNKLQILQEKNLNDMAKRGGHRRETYRHERAREYTKESAKRISRKFHKLLRNDFEKFDRHVDQIRRWSRVVQLHEGQARAEYAEAQYNKHILQGTAILQKMVDKVFAHEPYPPTTDTRFVKNYNKKFYEIASKLYYTN